MPIPNGYIQYKRAKNCKCKQMPKDYGMCDPCERAWLKAADKALNPNHKKPVSGKRKA